MNWIIASMLMFFSSVALYLCVRKSNDLKTPQQLNNLAMFLIPVLLYLTIEIGKPTNFILKPADYALIIIQAIFFSYLGNVFSLKGIENSPNPGYSLIISKSYVVFTSIASIYLFSAPLTIKAGLSILFIIAFSALISIDKNKNKSTSNSIWLPYTFGAFFCWGFLALSSKYQLNQGIPILTRLIIQYAIATILILVELFQKKINTKELSSKQIIILIIIGILGASFNYYMQLGFSLAPNVGFVNAANAASISLLTIMSGLIFKDELTPKKVIGVLGVTVGLILLFI